MIYLPCSLFKPKSSFYISYKGRDHFRDFEYRVVWQQALNPAETPWSFPDHAPVELAKYEIIMATLNPKTADFCPISGIIWP